MTSVHSPTRLAASLFVALSLTATACGGDSPAETADPAAGAGGSTVADTDPGDLATSDDVRLIEVLEVDTGESTTLADTVTGDRPVLLWFWAPH